MLPTVLPVIKIGIAHATFCWKIWPCENSRSRSRGRLQVCRVCRMMGVAGEVLVHSRERFTPQGTIGVRTPEPPLWIMMIPLRFLVPTAAVIAGSILLGTVFDGVKIYGALYWASRMWSNDFACSLLIGLRNLSELPHILILLGRFCVTLHTAGTLCFDICPHTCRHAGGQ
jgi:hypothetical protein